MHRSPSNILEILFIKHMWIFNLMTLTAIAYFLAQGAGELITARILESLPKVERSPRPRQRPRHPRMQRASKPPTGRAILARNIFDSSVGPIDPDAPVEVSVEEVAEEEKELLPCDDQELKLLATVVSDTNEQWSFASLVQGKERHLHRAGDRVGDRTVADITWQYVFFEEEDGYCYLDMFSVAPNNFCLRWWE